MRLLLHAVFLKMKKLFQSFIYLLFFYFELDLNKRSKKIYSMICYYQKEKEVCSKYFSFKIFCRVLQTACQKKCNNDKKVSYYFTLDKANGLEKVYNVPKRFICSFARPLS